MIKNKAVLEVVVNGRVYQMECDPSAPLGEVHDALSQMKGYVIQRMVDSEKSSDIKKESEGE